MSAYAHDVTTADFKEKVFDVSMNTPVVVDFWAEWCAPCKALKPMLEKLAEEYGGNFILAKVNADENPELTGHFGIRSLPTVVAFVNGQVVDGFTGAKPEGEVRDFLARFVAPAEPAESISLFEQAQAAHAAGDMEASKQLLQATLAAEPDNSDAALYLTQVYLDEGELDAAETLLNSVIAAAANSRADALLARIALARRSAGIDLGALQARIDAEPDNHALRLELAEALAGQQNWRGALEHLLLSVKKDRNWNEESARKAMLKLFDLLSADESQQALVREFRTQLARTLN